MSDITPAARKSSLHTVTTVLSSLVIPLPILVGRLVEAILDGANPAGVDTTQDLAYLREILVSSFVSAGVLVALVVVLLVLLYRRARTRDAIALPLLVLIVQLVAAAVILLLTGITND